MKKYFVAETDEEIEIGDNIQLDMTKKTRHGVHKVEGEVELNELSIPLLLEIGAIEEREVEEEEDSTPGEALLDFGDGTSSEALEALEEKVKSLEQEIRQLKGMRKDYVALTHEMLDAFKEFVLSLPDKEEKTAKTKKK